MARYSAKSSGILKGCHPDIQRLFKEVVKGFDNTVVCGRRSQEEQVHLYNRGLSKTLTSKHTLDPSEAIDAYPYTAEKGVSYDLTECAYFAGYVKGLAKSMDIELIWGGDWKDTKNLTSNRFKDYGHFELKRRG